MLRDSQVQILYHVGDLIFSALDRFARQVLSASPKVGTQFSGVDEFPDFEPLRASLKRPTNAWKHDAKHGRDDAETHQPFPVERHAQAAEDDAHHDQQFGTALHKPPVQQTGCVFARQACRYS